MLTFIRKFLTAILLFPSAILLGLLMIHNKHGVEFYLWPITPSDSPIMVHLGWLLVILAVVFFLLGVVLTAVTLSGSVIRGAQLSGAREKIAELEAEQERKERETRALTSVETAKGRDVAISQS